MERESFENREIADLLNENYISIKLDREERPDIDHVYMEFCQIMTGSGGWPLSVFTDSEARPFFAGTYFPKERFKPLLKQLNDMYKGNRGKLNDIYKTVSAALNGITPNEAALLGNPMAVAFSHFNKIHDDKNGGFGAAPKFPTPHIILFLLEYYRTHNEKRALQMAEATLDSMRRGGIYDHIGFGFSRYSTDSKWLAPHFEKMLYDNSLLAYAYAKAYSITGADKHAETARCTLDYIIRALQSPEGGFYSAEDADSEGEEGKFYLWSHSEVENILKDDAHEFGAIYDITPQGNFEGKSIPNLLAGEIPMEKIKWARQCIDKLFARREKKTHPFLDDKILTSWNGLAIAAFAYAGRILKRNDYISCAHRAADFIESRLTDERGRLLSRYRDGESKYIAHAEDYVFYIWGLIELHRAFGNIEYLKRAQNLTDVLMNEFWDNKGGGLFFSSRFGEKLIFNPKGVYDGAMPSANSVCAMNMLRLSAVTGEGRYGDFAEKIFSAFSGEISGNPASCAYLTLAFLYKKTDVIRVEIKANGQHEADRFIKLIPNDAEVLINKAKHSAQQGSYDPAEVFVCKGGVCYPPVTTEEELSKLLI